MNFQTFQSKVTERKQLTKDVIILSLTTPEDFTFKAGQFVSLRMEKDGEKKLKSYSILSPPSQKGQIDLCIKIVDGGFASEIFRKTKVGDPFEIKGPFGHFFFREDDENEEFWFLGGGTGVAPFCSMAKEYLPKIKNKKFILIFSVKTKEDMFLNEEFEELQKKFSNFKYVPTLTREEWDGAQGRVQKHLPEDLKNKTFYICGLKELVLETKELLLKGGVSSKDVKFERYS